MSDEGGQPQGQDEAEAAEPEPAAEALLEKLRYLQAEFENYRKRVEKERAELFRAANLALVADLLPTLDAFDGALNALDGDAREGIALVHRGLAKVLEAAGLQEIAAEGAPFDPYLHEVAGFAEGGDDGNVAEVVQKGYTFQARVLRPSKVIVWKSGGEDE